MAQELVPHIPEDAPFTTSQRAWLNGFLAGLYSYAPAQENGAKALRVALLYGSQTGTAEGLARKLAKELKAVGFEIVMNSLEGYVPATLAAESHALFIVSTYGEGDAPDAAQAFFQQLCVEHFPLLGNLSYGVLALGDSHYERFCQFGKDLDAKLLGLGGTHILDRVDSDVEVDAPYAAWKKSVKDLLQELAAGAKRQTEATANEPDGGPGRHAALTAADESAKHTRDNPCMAVVADKRSLTHPSSTKLTIHLSFAIADSDIRYEAGDACGLIPYNDPELVDAVLALLPFTGSEVVELPKIGALPLRQALLERFAIHRLNRNMVTSYAAMAECAHLQALLPPERQQDFEQWLHGRDLFDLLRECPGVLSSPQDLIGMLPRLTPRLYSISSSPSAHPGEVHTTVSVVRYHAHQRQRGGVCSTLLADRVEVGDRLPLFIQPNKKFRLPEDSSAPMIMIGPGTGIAPFRGFLHERRAKGSRGKNWLFFGERSATSDFLYRDELEQMRGEEHLTHLDTAFSRDQQQKVYVQDLMLQKGKLLWSWLEEGAHLYVCGDAQRMAKDVDRTLRKIVEEHGGIPEETAEMYVQELKDERRYQRDIY